MSRRSRRPAPETGLSFLDVISCGFGAVILLLIITKTVEPIVLEQTREDLDALLAQLQRELFEIRGETRIVRHELDESRDTLDDEEALLAARRADFSRIQSRFDTLRRNSDAEEQVEQQLADARQSLTEEMERLLGRQHERENNVVAGIPVDSEYIIFVIDTSGSMFNYSWNLMIDKLVETLDIYPEVKGIQVMNDMGDYMFSNYAGQWMPDTPGRRRVITERLRSWNPFSNSSPVEGITVAIRSFWAPDKKISIYVFGDEFTGGSIASVVDTVDVINRADSAGNRRVRIHGVGFPVQFDPRSREQITGVRFAALMRELAHRNGGTFVGLDDYE